MNPDFEVDAESLLRHATAVTGFSGRVAAAAGRVPAPEPSPLWATTGATDLLADTARRMVSLLARDAGETADRIRAAATAYTEADARAATRLRMAR